MPSNDDNAWQAYKDSLPVNERWFHCNNRQPHEPHQYNIMFNDSAYPNVMCPGTPIMVDPSMDESNVMGVARMTTEKSLSGTHTHTRPSWDDFFIKQLPALARRTTCNRGRSAAIFVKDNDQLAAGYVGSPPGMPHCDDVGHLWDKTGTHCLRTIHAEQNAMIRALRHGISLYGTTVYCTMTPCFTCAKLMAGVGVQRVVALHRYHDDMHTRKLFNDINISLVIMTDTHLYQPHDNAAPQRESKSDIHDDKRRDLVCPKHNVPFSVISKSPGGERVCPFGESWRVDSSGTMINLDELEWGEAENLG
jgi:dCMP deaminase